MAAKLLRPGGLREFARLAAEAAAVGVFASIVLVGAALMISSAKAATPDVPHAGALLLRDGGGSVPAPLVATDVHVEVAGIVARTRVTQRFVNPGADWREGVYMFPLPETSAVDHLQMRIGARRIQGEIRERAQARRDYDQAKAQGRKTALVEQERRNLFTTSVAPIGPNEEVTVEIEYQEALRFDSGQFALRFPMAITPRYAPDTPRIAPPVVHPAHGKVLPVTLTVVLNAGFPLSKLTSRYHAVKVGEAVDGRFTVTLDGPVPADRDFLLEWTPDVGRAPGAAVFTEQHDGRTYALVMLVPNTPEADSPRLPREATYIIDTSGSMAGTSIVQAKAALMFALDRLAPGDRFNIIEFNSHARALYDAPAPVDAATLARARSFVAALKAGGGTEMREALTLALRPTSTEGLVRQVVFLTDGAVGNEDALFALIRGRLGDRRLFTVAIGSAPNSHFMTKAAQFGRGTFTSIGDVREVAEKMEALIGKLERPVLTDVAIDWPGAVEAWPRELPDLYAGEPLIVKAALGDGQDGAIVLHGRFGGRPWRTSLPLAGNGAAAGVRSLWARAKIESLSDLAIAGASAADVRAEIVRVALAHHLVSRHTSLVAVDATPSAPAGVEAVRTAIPVNLPEGQVFDAIFGVPQTATPARRDLAIAIGAMLAALLLLSVIPGQRGVLARGYAERP